MLIYLFVSIGLSHIATIISHISWVVFKTHAT